jgi:hypothetical protein
VREVGSDEDGNVLIHWRTIGDIVLCVFFWFCCWFCCWICC